MVRETDRARRILQDGASWSTGCRRRAPERSCAPRCGESPTARSTRSRRRSRIRPSSTRSRVRSEQSGTLPPDGVGLIPAVPGRGAFSGRIDRVLASCGGASSGRRPARIAADLIGTAVFTGLQELRARLRKKRRAERLRRGPPSDWREAPDPARWAALRSLTSAAPRLVRVARGDHPVAHRRHRAGEGTSHRRSHARLRCRRARAAPDRT